MIHNDYETGMVKDVRSYDYALQSDEINRLASSRDLANRQAAGAAPMTNDYHGPCLILLDRSTTVEVRRGGRIESVSMPTTHDEPSGVK